MTPMRSATLRSIVGRCDTVGALRLVAARNCAGRCAMQSPDTCPPHGLRSAAAGLRSRISTAFSSACTFCVCSSCIEATSLAAAAVVARPARLPELRCVDAVCWRPVLELVVLREPPEGWLCAELSWLGSLCDERELLAV